MPTASLHDGRTRKGRRFRQNPLDQIEAIKRDIENRPEPLFQKGQLLNTPQGQLPINRLYWTHPEWQYRFTRPDGYPTPYYLESTLISHNS